MKEGGVQEEEVCKEKGCVGRRAMFKERCAGRSVGRSVWGKKASWLEELLTITWPADGLYFLCGVHCGLHFVKKENGLRVYQSRFCYVLFVHNVMHWFLRHCFPWLIVLRSFYLFWYNLLTHLSLLLILFMYFIVKNEEKKMLSHLYSNSKCPSKKYSAYKSYACLQIIDFLGSFNVIFYATQKGVNFSTLLKLRVYNMINMIDW